MVTDIFGKVNNSYSEREIELMFPDIVYRLSSKKGVPKYSIYEALFECNDDGLILHVDNLYSISESMAIALLFFFEKYDKKNKIIIHKANYGISRFFVHFKSVTRALGIKIDFDISIKNIANFLSNEYFLPDEYKNIFLRVNYFKKDIRITKPSNEIYDQIKDIILEEDKTERPQMLQEITNLEEPKDFVNKYENDYRASTISEKTIKAGLIRSLYELGRVDIQFISKITNRKMKDVILELKGLIYQNPEKWNYIFYEGYEIADEYLSGNLMQKLIVAKKWNKDFQGYFKDNVSSLSKLISEKGTITDFYVSLGAPFVPNHILSDFFIKKVYCKKDYYRFNIFSNRYNSDFANRIIDDKSYYRNYCPAKSITRYGISKFDYKNKKKSDKFYRDLSPVDVFENLINNKLNYAKYDDYETGKTIVDEELTFVVREKEAVLEQDFKEFVRENNKYYDELTKIYNERFGYFKKRVFDGHFLDFPGKNEDLELYEYQKNAIARIVFSKNTLLSHQVGSGKTFIMIASGMELKRMGISKKNLYVVPNNILSQWEEMFLYAYPDANILYIDNKKFNKKNRFNILQQIRDENHDAIIMAYSSFDRVLSKSLLSNDKIDGSEIYFEDLGINTLFVDEAHNYKNVTIESNLKNTLGINMSGSKKCNGLMAKCMYVQKTNGGRGVVFATGTPITNSISDLYNIQKYLQNDELKSIGLDAFDAWRGMFASVKSNFEVDVDTQKFRIANRFSEFHNVVELNDILAQVIDYHELDKESRVIPKCDGYNDVLVEKTKELNDYLLKISERVDKVRRNEVSRIEDNMLKITVDGRKAALDIRIVNDKIKTYESGKVNKCIQNVKRIYDEYNENLSTQVIFCDLSISNVNKSFNGIEEPFSVYDELKQKLIELGVSSTHIAFIHDASTDKEKQKIYDDFNEGKIRILIGSTFKLGMGVNIQRKLIALHHLDVPWRPSDMTQREGRILREGNENEKVFIYRYITKETFDAYSWQILETKQKFITQILSSQIDVRNIAEVDSTVLTFAEAKALACSNPLIKEKFELTNQLNHLQLLEKTFINNIEMQKAELKILPSRIEMNNKLIDEVKKDIELRNEERAKSIKISKENKEKISTNIYENFFANETNGEHKEGIRYKGFTLYSANNSVSTNLILTIKGNGEYSVNLGSDKTKFLDKIDRVINNLDERLSKLISTKEKLEQDKIYLENYKEEEFDKYGEIEELKNKIMAIDKKLNSK